MPKHFNDVGVAMVEKGARDFLTVDESISEETRRGGDYREVWFGSDIDSVVIDAVKRLGSEFSVMDVVLILGAIPKYYGAVRRRLDRLCDLGFLRVRRKVVRRRRVLRYSKVRRWMPDTLMKSE